MVYLEGMENEWWRGGVIYQIYPRSFADSNGDGIGDLHGITEHLDYVASLGVDGIWISPFFTSPMKDFGYDVSDYLNVDPLFGSLTDFKTLIEKAHSLNIKVMIDQVISHSSDQHPWFKESRSSLDNDKADWYVWADPKDDGTPPNNWLSIFGGSAWEWDSRRQQYYMHNFLTSQPDLNFHNPNVRQAVLSAMEFWLELGVDGFRLDTANFYFHDLQLRNNPPNTSGKGFDVPDSNPYSRQEHLYDKTQPENVRFLEEVRLMMNKYPNTTTVGEIGDSRAMSLMGTYTEHNKRLHMVYTFDFLGADQSPEYFKHTIETLESNIGDGWPCWAFNNHDVMRSVSRWGANLSTTQRNNFAKFLIGFLTSLRGSCCIYEGEELGLTEADIPYEKLQDPYGIRFWPEFKGRDGCRTPMPWNSSTPNGGFSPSEPWLPIPDEHLAHAVNIQEEQEASTLAHYRHVLNWRKNHPALRFGEITFQDAPKDTLIYDRSFRNETIRVVANFATSDLSISTDGWSTPSLIGNSGYDTTLDNNTLVLPPHSIGFVRLEQQ